MGTVFGLQIVVTAVDGTLCPFADNISPVNGLVYLPAVVISVEERTHLY